MHDAAELGVFGTEAIVFGLETHTSESAVSAPRTSLDERPVGERDGTEYGPLHAGLPARGQGHESRESSGHEGQDFPDSPKTQLMARWTKDGTRISHVEA